GQLQGSFDELKNEFKRSAPSSLSSTSLLQQESDNRARANGSSTPNFSAVNMSFSKTLSPISSSDCTASPGTILGLSPIGVAARMRTPESQHQDDPPGSSRAGRMWSPIPSISETMPRFEQAQCFRDRGPGQVPPLPAQKH
ncbi:unnamed protein product, partial [Polarella glacialis]